MDKKSKIENKQVSTFSKKSQPESSSESHIELDSRILSALLTVSIDLLLLLQRLLHVTVEWIGTYWLS